jgi:Ca-activated chloride channel family protein
MDRINQPILSPRTEPRIDFGLIAWLEETRIRLPLQGVECRFEVSGDVASVEMEQVFQQTNTVPLNCTYTFPLPGNAAVYRCEVQIGSRTIVARVEEQEKARRIFREKVEAGHRAGLVEMERENLFTLSLGNIQPKDSITVKLAYFQTVERCNHELSLLVPFCPGVRYIPGRPLWRDSSGKGTVPDTDQVPDASRISPPRIDANHDDAAYVSVTGLLCLVDAASISCPLHKINIASKGESVFVDLQFRADVPDRDFVLRWREKISTETTVKGWSYESDGHTYALAQLKAPENAHVADACEQDHYFLVDRSGSMAGEKWAATTEALKRFVRQLSANDRVWITFFETTFADFAERPMAPAELLKDRNFLHIEKRGASGGTEMLPALRHITARAAELSFKQSRPANLVIITDGEVGNEEAIIEALRPFPDFRTFTFGIDGTVNDAFLRNLARRQRGVAVFRTPVEDISGAVEALASKLRKPVLTAIQPAENWESAASSLPDLFGGDLLLVPLRISGTQDCVAFSGRLPDGSAHTISVALTPSTNPAIKLLWFKDRIQRLLEEGKASEAVTLAIANNIICKGAAFVAWDEQEKVAVAQEELYQPSIWNLTLGSCDVRDVSPLAEPAAHVGKFLARMGSCAFLGSPAEGLVLKALFGESGKRLFEGLERWAAAGDTARRHAALKKFYAQLLKHGSEPGKCKQLCLQFVREQIIEHELSGLIGNLLKGLKQNRTDPAACRQSCETFLRELGQTQTEDILALCNGLQVRDMKQTDVRT